MSCECREIVERENEAHHVEVEGIFINIDSIPRLPVRCINQLSEFRKAHRRFDRQFLDTEFDVGCKQCVVDCDRRAWSWSERFQV